MADFIVPKIKAFVESSVSDDFGLSVEQVAQNCRGIGRFRAWLNDDINKIREVLNIVKSRGVSPAFFASYEKTEGYNRKWGWLNHTIRQGTFVQDALSVSNWIVSASNNKSGVPAWIDYANYKDFVPSSIKTQGNNHFASLPSGVIGRVVISGTAAATWEVYYPLGLKKEYNGVQNYAAPINSMVDTILSWGGVIDGTSGVEECFQGNIIDFYLNSDSNLTITSDYGMRFHPIHQEWRMHAGTDIGKAGDPSPETPVPIRSRILEAGYQGVSAGNWVVYNPIGSPYVVGIFHFAKVHVKKGDIIATGESVGIMGATGGVTGRHWHIEVRNLYTGSYWLSTHYDPTTIVFDICTSGGGGTNPPLVKDEIDLVHLYLAGTVNNWGIE